ncbi:MAG: CBS domain-containing protein [Desulfamplus sp.]|nr:CBS domain-containing protein [Desulfamplus sp.]
MNEKQQKNNTDIIINRRIKTDTIITSHVNSDFDSVASMLAAQKLYPDSIVIFPGSQEKSLRDFFISSMSYLFNMATPSAIDFSSVKTLVIVDTKQKHRVPAVIELIERSISGLDVELHIYDHHPNQEDDLKGSFEVYCQTGATVTILSKILREKDIAITPEEATVMALGIYEDTGSFTYSSTTEADFIEAGYLVSCGASINTIADLITREISTDQVTWLNSLLNEITCHRINGFDIHISTIYSPSYITDLASIVQKLVKIEDINVFFAIVLMENKITIVARSRIEEVDVGQILSSMGGGGHAYAASAKITDKTLAQVELELLNIIKNRVRIRQIVLELMSSPPIIIDAMMPCSRASRLMTRYNINALLVSEGERNNLTGYVSRQVIEKTLYHNLAHLPVKEYMTTEMSTISPDADISEIQSKIMEGKQRILPVIRKSSPNNSDVAATNSESLNLIDKKDSISDSEVIGVITRTDLFNFLISYDKNSKIAHHETAHGREDKSVRNARKRNIEPFLKERLDLKILELLKDIGMVGDKIGVEVFVVGGFVRDLLLYRKSDDIDIVVEGDGIAFAKQLAEMKSGRCNTHPEFGTAVVILPSGFKIDVASARLEYYKAPAALPTVEMSSIKLDLFRRDFTINTLAIKLNLEEFGTIIDFFGAQRDLKDKTIRIIHNLSFVEDPTRIFRAIRFANRFSFTIGKLTLSLIKNAIKLDFFKNLSGLRVFSEIKQILEEENPIPAIENIREYQLDRVIHPEFSIDRETIAILSSVKKTLAWHDLLYLDVEYLRWSLYFMVMMRRTPIRVCEEICEKFQLPPRQRSIVLRDRLRADERLYLMEKSMAEKSADVKSQSFRNSELYNLMSPFRIEHILYMMATSKKEEVRKSISWFYTQLKDTAVSVRGRDLIEMGVKPGPDYKNIIQSVLEAKLDGQLKSREDELDFVKAILKKHN